MEGFFIIYIVASIISLMILYFIIKSAVATAIRETRKEDKETIRLLRGILIKLDGNVAEFAKIDSLVEEEFTKNKRVLDKKISGDRAYYSKLKELQNRCLQMEYELKSKFHPEQS